MILKRAVTALAAVYTVCGASGAARGGLVTWEFSGVITRVVDSENVLGGAIAVGDPFSGQFTFESSTPDSLPFLPDSGRYENAVTSVFGSIGNDLFSTYVDPINYIAVVDDDRSEIYHVVAPVSLLDQPMEFHLLLLGSDGTALDSDALPLHPPEIEQFDVRKILIGDGLQILPGIVDITGEIIALTPEPSTLTLLGMGLAATTLRRRRRCPAIGVQ